MHNASQIAANRKAYKTPYLNQGKVFITVLNYMSNPKGLN
jgi:hypothetical protein